jgi:hypothetical protein
VTKEYDLVGRSERQVDKEIVGCDVGVTKEKGLVCGIEKQDDRMTERCGGLQSEVRTERYYKMMN